MKNLLEYISVNDSITHQKVPVRYEANEQCLGPEGSAAYVARVLKLISGRWTLPIIFRLYAAPTMRHSQFLRSLPDISHKVLTQHLRKLERDGLILRTDFSEQPPRVEYGLSASGRALVPVLTAMRDYARHYPVEPEFFLMHK